MQQWQGVGYRLADSIDNIAHQLAHATLLRMVEMNGYQQVCHTCGLVFNPKPDKST